MVRELFQAISRGSPCFRPVGVFVAVTFFPIYILATHFPDLDATKAYSFLAPSTTDSDTKFAKRLDAIRKDLPSSGVVRYQFNNPDGTPADAPFGRYYLTRYFLAPLALSYTAKSDFVLIDSEDSITVFRPALNN